MKNHQALGKVLLGFVLGIAVFLSACQGPLAGKATGAGSGGLSLTVPDVLPIESSCDGNPGDIIPTIAWQVDSDSNVDNNAQSFALIMKDKTLEESPTGLYSHLVLWNIPIQARSMRNNGVFFDQNGNDFPSSPRVGYSDAAEANTYAGPCPPDGERHEYQFTLYALNTDDFSSSLDYPDQSGAGDLERLFKDDPSLVIDTGEAISWYPALAGATTATDVCTGTTDISFSEWVSPDDAVLVWDRNDDGQIQAADFFGEKSLVGRNIANGFEDLALVDSNGDGVINPSDPQFAKLRVWKNGEILPLAEGGVAEVRVHYYETGDAVFQQQGTYKSIRAVELETQMESLLADFDAAGAELNTAQAEGADTSAIHSRISTINSQIQVATAELGVENNRIIGDGYFLLADGATRAGSILTLDLDGTTDDLDGDGDTRDSNELEAEMKEVMVACPTVTVPVTSICGNGVKESGETCDDANIINEVTCDRYGTNTDYCESCSADCASKLIIPAQYCGDGISQGPEQCDDGANNGNFAVCRSTCFYRTVDVEGFFQELVNELSRGDRNEVQKRSTAGNLLRMFLRGLRN